MGNVVLVDSLEQIAILTLNQPERDNGIVPELLNELLDVLDGLRRQSRLRALVLQANGRSFSIGDDVRGFLDHLQDIADYASFVVGQLNDAILALVAFPVPVVAAVHGLVAGGSLGFVLASDLVLVSPEASFAPSFGAIGTSPDGGWTAMLPSVIGTKRAAEALLLDQPIAAEQAVAWGLANRIVPAAQIRAEALAVAATIAHQQPASVQRTKRLLWRDCDRLAAQLEEERQQFVRQIATSEAQFRIAAYLNRDKPSDREMSDRG